MTDVAREAAMMSLQVAISDVSRRCFRSTWDMGVSAQLWLIVINGQSEHLGEGIVTDEDIEHLRALSRAARGWVDWPRRMTEPVFHSWGSWKRQLAKYEAEQAARAARGKAR